MTATLLLAAALLAQSAAAPSVATGEGGAIAYDELAQGDANGAIGRLTGRSDDPGALINLGAAYARKGMKREALDCYRAAIASEMRTDVQLGDGRWMDSRRAARIAAESLLKTGNLAMR